MIFYYFLFSISLLTKCMLFFVSLPIKSVRYEKFSILITHLLLNLNDAVQNAKKSTSTAVIDKIYTRKLENMLF